MVNLDNAANESSGRFHPPPPGTATDATRAKNQLVAEHLPLADQSDFVNARWGLRHKINGGIIRNADGQNVVDTANYNFLAEPSPDTVNPSLWRISQLNTIHGLFEITPDVYQVRGYDIPAMTFVRGTNGWIIIDPLLTIEASKAAFGLVKEKLDDLPVSAVLITHSHADHFGGIRGVVDEDQVISDEVPVFAPAGFTEDVVSAMVVAGNHMLRRSVYQFGLTLPLAANGLVETGRRRGEPGHGQGYAR